MQTTMATQTAPKYSIKMQFNGEEYQAKGKTVEEALLSLKPDVLLTEVYVTAYKGKEESERRLSLKQAKKVFVDDVTRQVFINNLLLN